VPERQLRLFEHPKPLLTRLGADFFKSIPPRPGVYLMFGEADRLLYVGQSSNLRVRLGTYKNANPAHVPRKVLRLVHSVATIKVEPCETALAARLRENELLRTHRPRFNRMNTWPKAYWFVGCREEGTRRHLWLTHEPDKSDDIYGAFKANTRAAFGALLRLLHQPVSLTRPPLSFELPAQPGGARLCRASDDIRDFLAGTSDRLLSNAQPINDSLFAKSLFDHDQELLRQFFEKGPARNRRLCQKHGLTRIPQERLDDLIALG
jgi:GIY-YIG catalytic domain-containing protein